jgi:hypothetical protein
MEVEAVSELLGIARFTFHEGKVDDFKRLSEQCMEIVRTKCRCPRPAVPAAIEAAKRKGTSGATYVVGDVTDLPAADLGTFDFFLDVGCFQGLNAEQRDAEGHGVTTLANPEATLLMLAFGPTWMRSLLEGVSQEEVENAFPAWEMLAVDSADTRGLGWPMNRTRPQWYRLRRRTWKDSA